MRIFGEREIAPGDELTIGEQVIRIESFSAEPPKVIFHPIPSHTGVIEPAERLASDRDDAPAVTPGVAIESKVEPEAPSRPAAQFEERIVQALHTGTINLFDSDLPPAAEPKPQKTPPKKRAVSNLTFYTILGCLAAVGIVASLRGVPWSRSAPPPGATGAAVRRPGMTLEYSKKILTADNIFRFALELEIPEEEDRNGSAVFCIDDIRSQRCFRKECEVHRETLELLRSKIDASGIWAMKPPEAVHDAGGITRRLQLAEAPNVILFEVGGQYLPPELEKMEAVITDFAESYGLQTISLTPDELLSLAREAFLKAEDLYENREARLSNLRDAILRYQLVVNYLEQFSPKPPMWDRARKRLAEAEKLRRSKLNALELERVRLGNIRDLQQMRQVFLQVMELTAPDSQEYDTARQRLFKLDRHLGGNRR